MIASHALLVIYAIVELQLEAMLHLSTVRRPSKSVRLANTAQRNPSLLLHLQ